MDATSLTVFFKAALIGLLIAAPVGPIGLLTMQRTLEHGLAAGLATGMGAARWRTLCTARSGRLA